MRRFALALAEQLGYASPRLMLAEMSGAELRDWIAWFELKADDQRAAALDAKGKAKLRAMMRR